MFEEYHERIKELKDTEDGRCFILGCGPSLNEQDLTPLKNEKVIGCNANYFLLDDYDMKFDYYTVNEFGAAFSKRYKEILGLDTILFIGNPSAKEYYNRKKYYDKYKKAEVLLTDSNRIVTGEKSAWIDTDITHGTPMFRHIPGAMSIPVAYHLGFKEVYILGVDCDYSMPNNYFYGKRRANPEMLTKRYWDVAYEQYQALKDVFEADGRKIYNSTRGGRLEVYERKKFEDII